MFEPPPEPTPAQVAILSFLGQQFLATAGVFALALVASSLYLTDPVLSVAGSVIAYLLGFRIQRSVKRAAGMGRWVWVLPVLIWLEVVRETWSQTFAPMSLWQSVMAMFGTKNAADSEGLGIFFSSFAFWAIAYSIGSW